MWIVALVISYADVISTVVVGMTYLDAGARQAAHVTFGMVGVSLGLQALLTHLSGHTYTSCIMTSELRSYS